MTGFFRKAALTAAFALAISTSALAAGPDINATSTGLAIRGYDPVTYFTESAPKPGDYSITATHDGAVYRFVNEANKSKFMSAPEKYVPQFGGYCAFGAAMGKKFDGDPNVWRIIDDKLYLNLARSVQEKWEADRASMIKTANGNWQKIKDLNPDDIN